MMRTTIVSVGMGGSLCFGSHDARGAWGGFDLSQISRAPFPTPRHASHTPPIPPHATRCQPPAGSYITGSPEGSPGKGAETPANRYRGNPLNLIRVMPAKGQDMPTVASPRISLFLARLLGPVFVAIAIGVLGNGGVFPALARGSLRRPALVLLAGLFAI